MRNNSPQPRPGATRKHRFSSLLPPGVALGACALLLSACHSPGPGHLYLWLHTSPTELLDYDPVRAQPRSLPNQIRPGERVVGLAYDFNTDFLALRIEPGSSIRLFKRGESRFVREWTLPPEATVLAGSSGDLAFRPSDRHLFAVLPGTSTLLEYAVDGQLLRRLTLAPPSSYPVGGLAYDHVQRRLLGIMTVETPAATEAAAPTLTPSIIAINDQGSWSVVCALPSDVQPHALGANGEAGELYLFQRDGQVVVLNFKGHRLRTLPGHMPGTAQPAQIDAGPRSFVRIF